MTLSEADPILLALQSEFELIDQGQAQSFQNWYLGQLNSLDACRAVLKDQYQAMLHELDGRQRALEWRWYNDFRNAVEADLADPANKGKKSVNYLQGKAGYRKSREKLVVNDEAAAVAWAIENDCQGAIDMRLARTTPLIEKYQADKVVPDGCEISPAAEGFFPKRSLAELPAEDKQLQLEQENENG